MNADYLLIMLLWVLVGSVVGFLFTYLPFRSLRIKRAHSKASISPDLEKDENKAYRIERREPSLKVQDTFETPHTIDKNRGVSESLPEFVALYLIAPSNNPYTGYELWQVLINHQLEYGELQIFHRFSQIKTDDSQSHERHRIFSVANTAKPGHFDRINIGSIRCPGLCLFIETGATHDLSSAYQEMLSTAKQLAKALGGSLYNEQRHPLEALEV